MGERHRTYCRVVRLEDGFEVEGEPIPEREFSACRASENAAGFRCPLHPCSACAIWFSKCGRTVTTFTGHRILFVDVCTNFVHSDVEGFSGYAFGGRS